MPRKPIFRRRRASEDIDQAPAFYIEEGGAEVAIDFIAQLEATLNKISRQPDAGSPRYGHLMRIDALRSWPVKRFPYLIFYIEKEGRIEVSRVLHTHMDISSKLHGAE